MTSRHTKISPKTGRGLGHVTPTIFGSTVGYPSDSLASCLISHAIKQTILFDLNTVSVNLIVAKCTSLSKHNSRTSLYTHRQTQSNGVVRRTDRRADTMQHSSPYISNSND